MLPAPAAASRNHLTTSPIGVTRSTPGLGFKVSRTTTPLSSLCCASTISVTDVNFWTLYTTTTSFGMVEANHQPSPCQTRFTSLRRQQF